MDTENIGKTAVILGAGREKKEDKVDFAAGISIYKKTGDYVAAGEVIAELFTEKQSTLSGAEQSYLHSVTIEETEPPKQKLIMAYVDINGSEIFE